MAYSVKEIYYTLQGEGFHTGRAAIFCRFSGCNLWSGRESDRSNAICTFCDTDFVGTNGFNGGKFKNALSLVQAMERLWPDNASKKFLVCTGGEPLLQMDTELIKELHKHDFLVAIETNGTLLPPDGIDWICVSPKAGAEFRLKYGDELKIVYPQNGLNLKDYEHLQFKNFYLQPMDGINAEHNTRLTVEYCLQNPKWKLSLQTHKIINIP